MMSAASWSQHQFEILAALRPVNSDDRNYMFQQMLEVRGTKLVSPGWLVQGVGTCDVQTWKVRHDNVIPDLSGTTHTPWT